MIDRNLVITGAAGILGREVVSALATEYTNVIAIDLADSMPDCGQSDYIGSIDLTNESAFLPVINDLTARYRQIGGLVNIAGGFQWETLADGSPATWEKMFRINLLTAVNCSHAMLPLLRTNGGAIVNIGASATAKALAGMGAYTASKSGIARLTESLADEEKDNRIRVNAVLPSIIDTPTNRTDMPDEDHSRWVSPKELAGVIRFLLSDEASCVTGSSINVTGRC